MTKSQSKPNTKVADHADSSQVTKKRKFSRKVLHNRRRHKLNHRPHERVAIRAGRCSGIFRQQTDALEKGLKHKKVYTTGLSEVNRMGAPVCNMFAQMIEKRMSDICQALKVHAVHARRKTVKASDFHLFLKNQAAV